MEKNYFNENLNISYLDESKCEVNKDIILEHYVSSVIVYTIVYGILALNPFFIRVLGEYIDYALYMLVLYILIAPIVFFIFKPKSLCKSHNVEIVRFLRRFVTGFVKLDFTDINELKNGFKLLAPNYFEKQALILIFIKTFFGSLMISALLNNIEIIGTRLPEYKNFFVQDFDFIFKNLILFLFSTDLAVFVVGYMTELSFLNNKIRTVEMTPAGLFFCLICYPPFNHVMHIFIGSNYSENYAAFHNVNSVATIVLRIIALIFITIYVLASIALGTKASNLTNRGIVSRFPYNVIRHPAYISKNLFWFFMTIPMFFVSFTEINSHYIIKLILVILSWFLCATIYYFRALTEERHLSQDPDYIEYMKKVKYRFIPGVY